ncbi:hypothetical protein BYT27DRAFT_7336673 [Phlegmacium glaucopus]|nr:hypothetical protein BYT27DRAFT_7336673 [Phlegmacium glaucopus]
MNDSNDTSGNDPSEIEGPPPVFKMANDLLAYTFLMNATRSDCQPVELALGYRTLWLRMVDYEDDSLDWIDEMLRRSDPALFDFGSRVKRVDVSEDRYGVLELVFNYSSRLRIFSLQTPISNWQLVRSRFLQKPAPNLEFIEFCVPFDNECGFTGPLFDNHAPSLRHFQLRRCAVDFTSPVLTLLTELYVRQGLFERTFPGTIYLNLFLDYRGENGLEIFRPLVEHFRSFVKLESMNLDDSHEFILPHLQSISSPGSVFLPVLGAVRFTTAIFRRNEDLTPVAAFLPWREEQGFPIERVHINESHIDINLVLSLLQVGDVDVTMGTNYTDDTDDE